MNNWRRIHYIDAFLWKYGIRYAKVIKRIPFLRDIAEKQYRKLTRPQLGLFGAIQASGRPMVYMGNHRALTTTVFGHKMFVDTTDVSLTPHILFDGFWEMHLTKVLLRIVKEGMNAIDIGANIGIHSLLMASLLGEKGKVYCFEANPNVFEILHQNIILNGVLEKTVLCNKAVFQESGIKNFYILKQWHGGSALGIDEEVLKRYGDDATTIEVATTSLDEYFADQPASIDVMKIDAQGSEPFIFRGMEKLLENNPCIKIICEFSPPCISAMGEDPKGFLEYILNRGFRIRIIKLNSDMEQISPDDLLSIESCDLFLERK